jgi:hypothetical protein
VPTAADFLPPRQDSAIALKNDVVDYIRNISLTLASALGSLG